LEKRTSDLRGRSVGRSPIRAGNLTIRVSCALVVCRISGSRIRKAALRPVWIVNHKGRSHQRPQVPFLKGMEFRAETVYSRTASANTGILQARLWLGDRDRALLAIASFIILYSLPLRVERRPAIRAARFVSEADFHSGQRMKNPRRWNFIKSGQTGEL